MSPLQIATVDEESLIRTPRSHTEICEHRAQSAIVGLKLGPIAHIRFGTRHNLVHSKNQQRETRAPWTEIMMHDFNPGTPSNATESLDECMANSGCHLNESDTCVSWFQVQPEIARHPDPTWPSTRVSCFGVSDRSSFLYRNTVEPVTLQHNQHERLRQVDSDQGRT